MVDSHQSISQSESQKQYTEKKHVLKMGNLNDAAISLFSLLFTFSLSCVAVLRHFRIKYFPVYMK